MPRASASIGAEIEVGTRRARRSLREFENDVANSLRRMGSHRAPELPGPKIAPWTELHSKVQLAGTAMTGMARAGKSLFSAEENLVGMLNGLKAVSTGAESMQTQMNALVELSSKPGLSLPVVVKGSSALQQMGYSAKDSRDFMEQLGNEIARTNGSVENMDGFMVQMLQSLSGVRVEADEIKIMAEHLRGFRGAVAGINRENPRAFFDTFLERLKANDRAVQTNQQSLDKLKASAAMISGLKSEAGGIGGVIGEGSKFINSLMTEKIEGNGTGEKMARWLQDKLGIGNLKADVSEVAKGFELTDKDKERRAAVQRDREAATNEQNAKEAAKYMKQQDALLEAELAVQKARASGEEKALALAEDKLAILKDSKKLAEELKISEDEAISYIRRQNAARREGAREVDAAEKKKESQKDRAARHLEKTGRKLIMGAKSRPGGGGSRSQSTDEFRREHGDGGRDASDRPGVPALWTDVLTGKGKGETSVIPGFRHEIMRNDQIPAEIARLKGSAKQIQGSADVSPQQLEKLDEINESIRSLSNRLLRNK